MAILRILLLEDSLLDTQLIEATLSEGGINSELVRVETRADFQRALEQESFELILSDYSLPAFDGIAALAMAQTIRPEVPFIFVSATLGEELAIETLKSGATDYVLKQRLNRLVPAVKRALAETEERVERRRAESARQELAAELETRVEQRTAELAKANQSLKQEIVERQRVEESLRRSEITLRSYFALPLIGIAISSPAKGWIEVNDKLCDILGYERQELMQLSWVDITHPEDLALDLRQFNQLLAGELEGYSLDKRFICKNGDVIYTCISVRGIRQADGSIDYCVTLVQDITERKRAEEDRVRLIYEQAARLEAEVQGQKSAFLAQVSAHLSSSLDYETTLARVAQLAVPYVADWCAVDILDENQVIRRVAVAHQEPLKVELAWDLTGRYPEDINGAGAIAKVLRTGHSAIASEITDADLIKIAKDDEHLQLLRVLGLKSYICAPMLVRGRILGTITFVTAESNYHYTEAELPLIEDLAHRAALAVDNARLYQETQEARQIAEREAERNATLQAVTAALSEALTPAQVAEVVVNQGIKALGACSGFIALMTDNKTLEIVRALGYPPEILDTGTVYRLAASAPISDAVKIGKPLLIASGEVWLERYPHLATEQNHHAWADIPLIVDGRTVGGMGFSFPNPQRFSDDDCAFMQALAQQSAQAIERARAYAAERQARAEAEAANRTKDEFLAVLSHELRTPLNSMLGWTQLLLTRKFDEAKMHRALETIDRNTKSLAALIEDILDVSRIITGKLTISARACELVSVIEAALEAVRPAAEAKNIEIELFLDSSVSSVWGDTNRLQQVVWNLLSNAVKFTPQGGRVEVRLSGAGDSKDSAQNSKNIKADNPSENPQSKYAQIQVIDTGKGISPHFLPYVFERFRQENTSSTRVYGGLGLGLAIVRYLVELHGGTVQASSPGEGLGATFTVQLPLLEGSRRKGERHSDTATQGQKLPSQPLMSVQVLIVDDDADARALLATILEQAGAQVKAAASAAEALEFVSQSRIDVLVSDIAMPNVDGYQLIRQVRELEAKRGAYTPAIALTAYARDADRTSALNAGFQVHLSKPFDPDELVSVVAKLAEGKVTRINEMYSET